MNANDKLHDVQIKRLLWRLTEELSNPFKWRSDRFNREEARKTITNSLIDLKSQKCVKDFNVTLPYDDEPDENGILHVNVNVMLNPETIVHDLKIIN